MTWITFLVPGQNVKPTRSRHYSLSTAELTGTLEMTLLLLDTSAYIAFIKRHPEVIEIIQQTELIFICPIILGELRAGFLQGTKRGNNERELRLFLESSRVRVLAIDEETSERYALIHIGLKK